MASTKIDEKAKSAVLVTGGAGFIGANLCARLLAEGARVVCLDDLSTGRMENLAAFADDSRFEFVRHDVRQPFPARLAGFGRVFNLACAASPEHYQRDPAKTMATCFLGAWHALDLAEREGATVIQASTSEIYGDPLVHPQAESYNGNVDVTNPRACYDEGKRAAEALFFARRSASGVSIRIARIFNTYGPLMRPDDGRVVTNFIVQALAGRDLTLYGDGRQTRSFCYIDDLVEGLIRLSERPPAYFTGPVNLGNTDEFTMLELAELVLRIVGGKSGIRRLPLPAGDPRRRRPDIGLAERVLGWRPKVALEDGLRSLAEYLRTQKLEYEPIRP